MNIILCGMPGAGKTTVAEALALRTGRVLVDTDALIEARHGSISKIFSECGEAYFRSLEAELALELAGCEGLVIATGGGFVTRQGNCDALKKSGVIIYLRARKDTLQSRLAGDNTRPLLAGNLAEKLGAMLKARAPLYEQAADFTVDTDGLSQNEIAEKICSEVKV
ncbi:MAG: shikimate kinase [Clostridia bacterium]|nr:shikimate kinase [Clostridia bacterium]